ncbi:MAG TPA: methyltransferase domain-containing protein [Chitinophagaceae bacterium]|nr:methyltransferase domain-containing protein [Chitinophagaceae bacterium]
MQPHLELIREHQKTIWNNFSPGWEKWDEFNMRFLQPMGEAIIEYLQVKEDDIVLDIATGTGEPGLKIASLAKRGKVWGTDLSENMLAIASEHAAARGVKNYLTKVADVCELPFEDESFDAVSCRMGFMFFPDMDLAAREMFRVLKKGGRMAASVWGTPDKNPWIGAIMNVLGKYIELPAPPPGAPGMFRCSHPGLMSGLFVQAGFKNCAERGLGGMVNYGTAELYWQNMLEVAAPVVFALAKAGEATKSLIKRDLFELLHAKCPAGPLALGYAAIIFYGEK